MAILGQTSFRRILLSRILLVCVPILLMGVYVTYRKAVSSLQETARQNLTESAVRKGESIHESIEALKTNLATASETVVLQSGSPEAVQKFLDKLAPKLPTKVECVQLTDIQTNLLTASTCGSSPISTVSANNWPLHSIEQLQLYSNLIITTQLPRNTPTTSTSQLKLLLSAPVYNPQGKLLYALSVESALLLPTDQPESAQRGSLAGYTVVINQDGTILAHPIASRVGNNIANEVDGKRLQGAIKNALAGKSYFVHLYSFEKPGVESLAGYTTIPSPITSQPPQKWIILAVQTRANALFDLTLIGQLLLILTLSLIGASLLATLYIARELARPVEKLRDYALNQQYLHSTDRVPYKFKIREFNQLATALDNMVERLKAGAEELETAWKEAKAANHLKNEFLATTSHELRTPLNGIIGCIRLVKDGYCDNQEEELEMLQRADEAAIHLLGIINDVLDIAKIEAGKLDVVMEPIDLGKLLKEVIDLQAVSIQQKGLQFHTPDMGCAIALQADRAKLRQVLMNVIGNAVKFTESGSITITTRVEVRKSPQSRSLKSKIADSQQSQTSNYPIADRRAKPIALTSDSELVECVVVTVQDTGIGIDPAQQHKLFRPFVMVDGSTTRKFGGTGLGLAISGNFIDLMGGSIILFSEGEGKGTTVEISLPTR